MSPDTPLPADLVAHGRRSMRIVAGILLAEELFAWLYGVGDGEVVVRAAGIRTAVVIALSLGLLLGARVARWSTGAFLVFGLWVLGPAILRQAVTPPMGPNRLGILINITLSIVMLYMLVVPRSTQAFFDAARRARAGPAA